MLTTKKLVEMLTDGTAETYVSLKEYVSKLEEYCDAIEKQNYELILQVDMHSKVEVEKVHKEQMGHIKEKLKETHEEHANTLHLNYMLNSANKAQIKTIVQLEEQIKTLRAAAKYEWGD